MKTLPLEGEGWVGVKWRAWYRSIPLGYRPSPL
jgi:hypothetical protein